MRIKPMDAEALSAGIFVFLLAALCGRFQATSFDNYSYLADAFIHGRLWIVSPPGYLSYVPFGGHDFVCEPPLPGLLMIPFALFYHEQANQSLLATILLSIGVAALWRFLRRSRLDVLEAGFVTSVMLFATCYFYGGVRGDVWQLANVSAVTFTFLLFDEVSGKNRPWLVALFAVAAGLSRYTLLPHVIVYGLVGAWAFGRAYAKHYYFVVERAFVIFVAYNLARWGTLYDQGYRLYETAVTHQNQPMFALGNIPHQLQYMLTEPLHPAAHFPFLVPDDLGFGILFSGTVLFAALLAPRSRVSAALWVLMLLALLPNLLYYDNGDQQFGIRHELDFAPFLVALLALVVRAHKTRLIYYVGCFNVVCGIVWLTTFRMIYER
jgi:hypothetical protein